MYLLYTLLLQHFYHLVENQTNLSIILRLMNIIRHHVVYLKLYMFSANTVTKS